jgi:[acyl-carrier-protein] S-malonyltransferase
MTTWQHGRDARNARIEADAKLAKGKIVEATDASSSRVRLLSGIDGSPVLDTKAGLDKLTAQISQTVLWANCLEASVASGATAFLELGPGTALSEMIANTYHGVATRSRDDFKTLDGARNLLELHAAR